MIPGLTGAHVLLYSHDADADRAFLRDVLDLRSVDAGRGWLIFALPPAEVAVHPTDDAAAAEAKDEDAKALRADLYLMCDDVAAMVTRLAAKGAHCEPLADVRWGITTRLRLPSGGEIGLYQPKHPTAI